MLAKDHKQGIYKDIIKRFLDMVLSGVALIILSPVMIVVAILVKTKLGSPVVFRQKRPGKNERIFEMYKFRSMTDEKDDEGNLLPDEIRLTNFGKKLRSTSLDELPELINIFKGDMSIVGPRPLMVSYLPLYNEEQRHRHDVKPGLTGLAQISGRNSLTWQDRFKMDVYYVNNMSFFLDVKIFLKTIASVVRKDGITSETSETMEDFMGN